MIDHDRLICDLLEIETLRNRGLEIGGRARYRRTELKDIGALRHDDADADRCFASLPDQKIRRVGITVRHRGDVADAEHAAIRFHRRLGNRLGAVQRPGHAQRHALRRRLQHAGRHDRILPSQ